LFTGPVNHVDPGGNSLLRSRHGDENYSAIAEKYESRRDSGSKPRVARQPWDTGQKNTSNPNGVAAILSLNSLIVGSAFF
jgi:hypothetical protein